MAGMIFTVTTDSDTDSHMTAVVILMHDTAVLISTHVMAKVILTYPSSSSLISNGTSFKIEYCRTGETAVAMTIVVILTYVAAVMLMQVIAIVILICDGSCDIIDSFE